MELIVGPRRTPPVEALEVEIAERKGLGHPDTICDALAEELSRALSRFYEARFGHLLHHNVDKVLLRGGASRAAHGGGEVLAPIEIYLAGRATLEFGGQAVPVEALAVEGSREWLRRSLPGLDPERHARIHCLVRPGSKDLVQQYLRQQRTGVPVANDTCVGVGFAPLSDLEQAVLAVEARLNAPATKAACPEIGEDVKVFGVRRGRRTRLTVAAALVGRHVRTLRDYADKKERATSAEAGDDGQAGRGNRANGLITPYRPMALEAAAGKNPVTHAGKLYQVAAGRVAEALVAGLPTVVSAECYLASEIGRPIVDPQVADVKLGTRDARPAEALRGDVEAILRSELGRLEALWEAFLRGEVTVY